MRALTPTGLNDAATHPQTKGANCHDRETKVPATVAVGCHAKRSADASDQDDQPVKPAKQRNEANDRKVKGD
jgi:hypothetical protein